MTSDEHVAAIPDSHLDLLTGHARGVLTTIGTDGQPQSSLVQVDYEGTCACVDVDGHHARDVAANSKVSLLVVDPTDGSRYLHVRGDAELVTDGAAAHAQDRRTRATCRIHTRRVNLDAIHA